MEALEYRIEVVDKGDDIKFFPQYRYSGWLKVLGWFYIKGSWGLPSQHYSLSDASNAIDLEKKRNCVKINKYYIKYP